MVYVVLDSTFSFLFIPFLCCDVFKYPLLTVYVVLTTHFRLLLMSGSG